MAGCSCSVAEGVTEICKAKRFEGLDEDNNDALLFFARSESDSCFNRMFVT